LAFGDVEVRIVEIVVDVPAEGAESATFANDGVEEGEG